MPRKNNPVLFTIEVPVTRRTMNYAISRSLDEVTDYDPKDLKEAGINIKELGDALLVDPGFREAISKQMVNAASNGIAAALDYSDISHGNHPLIKETLRTMRRESQRLEKARAIRNREARIKEALEILQDSGYTVTKQRSKKVTG